MRTLVRSRHFALLYKLADLQKSPRPAPLPSPRPNLRRGYRAPARGRLPGKGTSAAAPRQREPTPAQRPLKQAQWTRHMNGSSTGEPPGTADSVGTLPCFLALAHLAAVRRVVSCHELLGQSYLIPQVCPIRISSRFSVHNRSTRRLKTPFATQSSDRSLPSFSLVALLLFELSFCQETS